MDNAQYNHDDIKRICKNKLDIDFRSNGELNGWFYHNGKKKRRITVSKGRKNVTRGTYKSMSKQLGLFVPEFDGLLDCRVDKSEFIQINDSRNWQRLF